MQFFKVFWGDGVRLSHQLYGCNRAGDGTYSTTDAPFLINDREITFHLNDLNRADLHTGSTTRTSLFICFSEEVGRHQDIPWNFLSPDRAHGPATAPAAIAGVFDPFPGIIHEMNQVKKRGTFMQDVLDIIRISKTIRTSPEFVGTLEVIYEQGCC